MVVVSVVVAVLTIIIVLGMNVLPLSMRVQRFRRAKGLSTDRIASPDA